MSVSEFARGFVQGFRGFGMFVNDVISFVLLLIVFLVGIGPVSLIGKATGKRFIPVGNEDRTSYWAPRILGTEAIERYEKQY